MDTDRHSWFDYQGFPQEGVDSASIWADRDLLTQLNPDRHFVGPPKPGRRRKPPSAEDLVEVPYPDAPRHLYALELDDLLNFTAEDVLAAWPLRNQCCGSIEVAAELYALYRVLTGDDESYAGAQAYLEAAVVRDIFSVPASEDRAVQVSVVLPEVIAPEPMAEPEPAPEPVPEPMADALDLADVRAMTVPKLQTAWANRPESFASLEAAAETLAILRSLNSREPVKPSFRFMMEHELIQDLMDALPLELDPVAPAPAPPPTVELALLRADQRTVRTQTAVVRPRQANFRSSLFQRYGGACCITGCRVETLLEAAHIIPYRGDQTDDVTNGLLLRVDLHRLFDAHLVSINPKTFKVEVARSIDDAGYQAYHGKQLFTFSPKPRILFLQTHFAEFMRAAGALR